jgi:hypothetical protein
MPSMRPATLHPVSRRLLMLTLDELRLIEEHLGNSTSRWPTCSPPTTMRCSVSPRSPGLGVDSAQQIIAEVGATTAATFPSSKHLASWMGTCPDNEESDREVSTLVDPRSSARGLISAGSTGYRWRSPSSLDRPDPRPARSMHSSLCRPCDALDISSGN